MTTILEFQTIADLCAEVDAAGPRQWLIRGIWPAGSYGVHAAEMKAQKTWNALDLAISVASHTPWLGTIPVDDPGPVLIFAGEGGKAAIVRRLRGICASRNILLELLPLVVSTRSPHLNSDDHLNLIAAQLAETKPRLVLLDPLYLAARGAKGSDLYAMGELLERAQHLCEPDNVALFAVTHYNRKEGSGPNRFTGAGPAEWGRVLIGARVVSRHTHPETKATTLLAELDIIGGEVPDQTLRVRRDIHTDNPDDLDSPLHYHVEIVPKDDTVADTTELAPAARKILEALETLKRPAMWRDIVDQIDEKHGHGLKRETVSRNLSTLEKGGLVECTNPDSAATDTKFWTIKTPLVTACDQLVTSQDPACDQTGRSQAITSTGDALVTDVISPYGRSHSHGHNPRSHHNGDHKPDENENFWRDDPLADEVTRSQADEISWAETQDAIYALQQQTGEYGFPIEDVIAEARRLRGEN
jgi:hypothetical protein